MGARALASVLQLPHLRRHSHIPQTHTPTHISPLWSLASLTASRQGIAPVCECSNTGSERLSGLPKVAQQGAAARLGAHRQGLWEVRVPEAGWDTFSTTQSASVHVSLCLQSTWGWAEHLREDWGAWLCSGVTWGDGMQGSCLGEYPFNTQAKA